MLKTNSVNYIGVMPQKIPLENNPITASEEIKLSLQICTTENITFTFSIFLVPCNE